MGDKISRLSGMYTIPYVHGTIQLNDAGNNLLLSGMYSIPHVHGGIKYDIYSFQIPGVRVGSLSCISSLAETKNTLL